MNPYGTAERPQPLQRSVNVEGCLVTRVLYFDVSRGATAVDLFGALVDLGVPPSPVLHALGSLPFAPHLAIEDSGHGVGVRASPPESPIVVRLRDLRTILAASELPAGAALIAGDAIERLLVATAPRVEGACILQHTLDASQVLGICAAAMAARHLGAEMVVCSRVPVDDDPSPAFVELLGSVADALDFGAPVPIGEDAAALLRAFVADEGFGVSEPAWRSVVARGRSAQGVHAALGEM